ncbi:MAG: TlpA disulfide reductase family protein [Pseudomonadota bacterium]
MNSFLTPRLWLFIWGGLGALLLAFILISASQDPKGSAIATATPTSDTSSEATTAVCKAKASDRAPSLLKGAVADFTYAFMARRAPGERFLRDGAETTLVDFRGKTVLVNFWATWCAPCLKELPSLNALQKKLGSETFEVVAVAADPKGPEAAKKYLRELDIDALTLYTDQKLALASAVGGVSVLPVSILYDANGKEIGRLRGETDWAADEAAALIENVISCS